MTMMMMMIIIIIIIIEDGQVYIGRGKEQSATARRTFNIESQHRANHWIQKDTNKNPVLHFWVAITENLPSAIQLQNNFGIWSGEVGPTPYELDVETMGAAATSKDQNSRPFSRKIHSGWAKSWEH